jgi:hypothetical protein
MIRLLLGLLILFALMHWKITLTIMLAWYYFGG